MTQRQHDKHVADKAARVPVPEVDVEELKTMAAPRDLPSLTWVNMKARPTSLNSRAGRSGYGQEQVEADIERASRGFADAVLTATLDNANVHAAEVAAELNRPAEETDETLRLPRNDA